MKTKKLFAILASAVVLTSVFASCTQQPTDDAADTGAADTTTTDTATDEPADEPADEPEVADLEGTVTLSGSSALYPLADLAIDPYNELYPDVAIELAKGGSGTGLSDVSAGKVMIGNSDVYAEEKLDADAAAELVDHQVCIASMATVVNSEVGIDDISTEDLIKIFTNEVSNWSEVGGPDMSIVLLTRPESSGTRATFDAYALDGAAEVKDSVDDIESDESADIHNLVQSTPGAIGYLSLSYLATESEGIVLASIDGVAPTFENIYAGDYDVWCYEHMYTKGEADELSASFIDFMMSEDFAPNIEEMGYGVTAKMTVER